MIVFSRKKNEGIMITDDISLLVVEIRGDKVRLGIESPREIQVHRKEVYDALKRKIESGLEVKTEKLEDSVSEEPSIQKSPYQQFREQLQKRDYLKAYSFYPQCSDLLTEDESSKLIKGFEDILFLLKASLVVRDNRRL